MGIDDVNHELRKRLNSARADLAEARASYSIAVFQAYQKPEAAEQGMQDYFNRHGKDALVRALAENPEQFGVRQGHALTKDGWKAGAPEREVKAKESLRSLADKVEVVAQCHERVKALHESIEPEIPEINRQRSRGGPER
ncbi:hypothetical protein [Ancylobacter sp. FA202]|uniref:hypothetical protein n=1 Tax=Ancylobacter sp. FA202 TaxID=1111106 RepID=UPI00036384E5|nr:hypothetical protein [Ancylobacter sp. FA202]